LRTQVEEELRRAEREGMLNFQMLAIKLLLHSSSFLERLEGKAYNENL
jgi:hypothetical protein